MDGETPLHAASRHGREAVARVLIDGGANVSTVDRNGCTPLPYVPHCEQEAPARLLINHGADVSATDHDGRSALKILHRFFALQEQKTFALKSGR
jgi:ankyrin repeat protein